MVRVILVLAAIAFGAIHAWAGRYGMNADGISYLDMADAFLRGDWTMAVSTVWSPLYAWLVAFGSAVLHPTPAWEFSATQLVNFTIYLGALAAFDFLMMELLAYRRERAARVSSDEAWRVPDRLLLAAGYMVFIWASLNLIRITLVTPHLTVTALLYLAAGLLLRVQRRPRAWAPYILLGIVLGLAYLARSPMFLLALIFLAFVMFARPRETQERGHFLRAFAAFTVFLVVAAVYAVPLFMIKGRLPLGDFARLNYAFWVNRYPQQHWQGEPRGSGTPTHPTRRIFVKPAVYEFAGPVGGTYPVWYDPSYWNDGMTPRFDLAAHGRNLVRSMVLESGEDSLSHWLTSLGMSAIVGLYAWRRGWIIRRELSAYAALFVVPIAALGMYAPIQLIDRYIGGFVPLLWLGVLSSVSVTAGQGAKRTVAGLALAVFAIHGLLTVPGVAKKAFDGMRDGGRSRVNVQWQVADGVLGMGVHPGAKVAVVGSGWNAYWARLARVQIAAEIPRGSALDFWAADEGVRRQIMRNLAGAGIEVVVSSPRDRARSSNAPRDLRALGWQPIGKTGYYAFVLRR